MLTTSVIVQKQEEASGVASNDQFQQKQVVKS